MRRRSVVRIIKSLFESVGLTVQRRVPETPPPDIDTLDLSIWKQIRPFTMTSIERVVAATSAARYIAGNGIQGDIVECGVWRGGSMMAIALALLQCGDTARTLYLYDTFDGMSPPTDRDVQFDGRTATDLLASDPAVRCDASLADVSANLRSTTYPADRIRLVQGRVEDTIPGQAPEAIALLRLDTDWYESTFHELEHLYPRLAPNGILIIDDYGHWRGSREATDEYFASRGLHPLLFRIDYTGRVLIKTTRLEA